MAKFKSVATGEVYEFNTDHDIAGMRVHSEYEEVVEELVAEEKSKKKKSEPSGE